MKSNSTSIYGIHTAAKLLTILRTDNTNNLDILLDKLEVYKQGMCNHSLQFKALLT